MNCAMGRESIFFGQSGFAVENYFQQWYHDSMTDTLTHLQTKQLDEEDAETSDSAPAFNLQKRDYDLDPTRYGDWELNGKCVDF